MKKLDFDDPIYLDEHDYVASDKLVASGAVDVVWGNGWRAPTVNNLQMAQHGIDQGQGTIPLPKRGVVFVFMLAWPDVVQRLDPDGAYIVVVRDGDPSLRNVSYPACVRHIFATNVPFSDSRVTPMPWGFYIPTDLRYLRDAQEVERKQTGRVVASFSLDMPGSVYVPPHERIACIEYFRHQPWATVNDRLLGWATRETWFNPSWSYDEYLKILRQYDFSATPVGYGVERMAYWEAVALGTIPIAIRHPEMLHFSDTPIAFVDSWNEVTPEWCDANLEVARTRSKEKLSASYWVARIEEKKRELL